MTISSINNSPNVPPVATPGGNLDPASQGASVAKAAAAAGQAQSLAAATNGTNNVNAQGTSSNDQEPSDKNLKDAVERVKNFVHTATSNVQFSIDDSTGIRVVKVVDKETNQVIRQMPSKEVVELAKALDKLQGLMIKQTA